ncbi:GNAT family N-acetyltransferase [Rhodobacteraceae bacterium NNCM2]|nr:GNAT family N-acetyltransferase [Coraliihabitans acroporae]
MNPTTITLRPASREDSAAMEQLLRLTDAHYGNAIKHAAGYAAVLADLLDSGYSETVIAWDGDAPVGYASYTFMQPTDGAGAQMFMKELFVADAARSKGVGRLLMRRMGEIAVARGCLRLDWTANTDNPRGLAFYDRLGAERMEKRVYYRVTDFDDFLERLSGD